VLLFVSKSSFYWFSRLRADKQLLCTIEEAMVEELRNIQREVLPNGLTILTEEMPHIRSVSIGIWVKTGSRHEDPKFNGISH
jgi:predicted Zn-dependent peptidase